ncbi:MAG: serine/threonine protein kinase [Niastella sp. SCN 39-18]|nr:APC family permease [Sphingobacteriales bacterium]ODT53707.1 MAG: serine/threonine protein kinase [Niastella sp. SCN 39-18]OJW09374.1 MAG: serine/threonine protein kinase [Sphingobacteriales bacterium 39-19]
MAEKKLNRFDMTMLMVSFVIGMGIFRTPVNVASHSPNQWVFFAAWVAGGLIAFCGALTYAEIGSRYPVTGGYYKIFSYAYHPSVAFGVNCIILISNAASLAAVALIGAEYISAVLFPVTYNRQVLQIIIAISCILIFYGVNLAGLKMSARAQNVLTIVKISMLLMLISAIFFAPATPSPALLQMEAGHPFLLEYIKAFGLGLVAVSFTYGGYQQSINFGDEVEAPAKNVPLAIFMGILIIVSLYLAINYAYIRVIGFDQLKSAENISALMASHLFGSNAGKIISILLFFSVLAYVNAVLMSNPRVMQAMADEGVLPASFARRSKKHQVLIKSLTLFASLSAFIVFWAETFDRILSFTIFLDCIGMALSAATLFILRKRQGKSGSHIYNMKLYPLMPLIFIFAYIFVAVSIFIDTPYTALLGLAILGTFIGFYFIIKHKKKM